MYLAEGERDKGAWGGGLCLVGLESCSKYTGSEMATMSCII